MTNTRWISRSTQISFLTAVAFGSILFMLTACSANLDKAKITKLKATSPVTFAATAEGGDVDAHTSRDFDVAKSIVGGNVQRKAATSSHFIVTGGIYGR